jgi:hypothetical protein
VAPDWPPICWLIRCGVCEGSAIVSRICYEPVSGSGSQLIAAEQLGRRCYALELEPLSRSSCRFVASASTKILRTSQPPGNRGTRPASTLPYAPSPPDRAEIVYRERPSPPCRAQSRRNRRVWLTLCFAPDRRSGGVEIIARLRGRFARLCLRSVALKLGSIAPEPSAKIDITGNLGPKSRLRARGRADRAPDLRSPVSSLFRAAVFRAILYPSTADPLAMNIIDASGSRGGHLESKVLGTHSASQSISPSTIATERGRGRAARLCIVLPVRGTCRGTPGSNLR